MDELNLTGTKPRYEPNPTRSLTITARLPVRAHAWLRDQAERDNTTPSMLIRRIVDQAMQRGRWPADVQDWLVVQAAQCGVVGDPDGAVIAVVRHLAERWPDGCRLSDPQTER